MVDENEGFLMLKNTKNNKILTKFKKNGQHIAAKTSTTNKDHHKTAKNGFPTIGETIVGRTLAPGGPQGRPRARGVYLINQVIIIKKID